MNTSENKQEKVADDFFGTNPIEDGSVQSCSEQYCSEKATCFASRKLGLHKVHVPLCEKHADEMWHAVNELPKVGKNPDAPCVLISNGKTYGWLILRCPYCGGQHWHGGGVVDDDPRKSLGFRVPHCIDPFAEHVNGQYRLVEEDAGREPVYKVVNGRCSNCGKTVFVPEGHENDLPE